MFFQLQKYFLILGKGVGVEFSKVIFRRFERHKLNSINVNPTLSYGVEAKRKASQSMVN